MKRTFTVSVESDAPNLKQYTVSISDPNGPENASYTSKVLLSAILKMGTWITDSFYKGMPDRRLAPEPTSIISYAYCARCKHPHNYNCNCGCDQYTPYLP